MADYNTLTANGDVTVAGDLSGANATLYFYGATLTNAGSSISVDNVSFNATGTQFITGGGSWTGTGTLTIDSGSNTYLANDVTMAFSQYVVYGTFSLDDHVLTFNPASTLTFTNYGTTSGSGAFRTSGTVSLYAGGTFDPPLEVVSGITTAYGTIGGAITVQIGATLKVYDSNNLTVLGDVTVHGDLSGANAGLTFYGATLTNTGSSISVDNVYFYGTGTQTITGAGSWTGTGQFYVAPSSITSLANDVTMALSDFKVHGSFSLDNHTLTFSSPTTLAFANWGTFAMGSQNLAFDALGGATFTNGGTTSGSGIFRTNGTVNLELFGAFNPPVEVVSGTTVAVGTINGAIIVQSGATLKVYDSNNLTVFGDMTVHGDLSGANATLNFYGSAFTNTGSAVSVDNVNFYGSTITITGSWTGTGTFYVDSGSSTTLANDVSMAFSQCGVAGSFLLDNHVLTFSSPTSLSFNNYGTFAMGSQTLAFDAPDGATFYNSGTTSGSGAFQTSGTVSLYAGSTFEPSLEVVSGITTAHGTIRGAIAVQVGATLKVQDSSGLTASSDVTLHGTLSGGDAGSYLSFHGTTFTNTGSSVSLDNVYFYSTGPQTITGAGSWTGTGQFYVDPGSITSLANDVTMAFSDFQVDGTFSLDNHTLTFSSPTTLSFNNYGTFAMGSQTLAFDAPDGATFTNYGTTSGSSTFQTSGTVSLHAYSTFDPPLEVVSGTTTAHGTIGGAITVQSGATLKVLDGNGLIGNSDVTVDGTLSGGNAGSSFILNGPTLTNNGSSVTVANVYFASGAHTLQGTGSFSNNTATIQSGATVDLGSDHQMSTVVIDSGGTFNITGYTLSLSGTGMPLTNNGTFGATNSTVVYNGTVPQTVATTNVDSDSLGIDNAAGVTLGGPETVPGSLILIDGRLYLGAHTLTLGDAATIGGTPSASAMVVADGNGYLRKTSAGPLTFTFPIGDVSGDYTPVALTCTTFPAGEAVDARLRDAKQPTMPGTTYLTRYWTLTSAATSAGCTGIFTYVQADVVGTEASLAPAKYNGVIWTLLGSGAVNVVDNTLTGTFESFSDFSGGEAIALAVNLASFAAEPTGDDVLVNWETVSEADNQGFNLYRSTTSEAVGDRVAFVPSQAPGSTQGAAYEWLDTEVEAGQTYWYWLEDIDLSGQTTLHGPVSVTVQTPTAVRLASLQAASGDGPSTAGLALTTGLAVLAVGAALGMRRKLVR